jgi:hypothetical protein
MAKVTGYFWTGAYVGTLSAYSMDNIDITCACG